MAGRGTLHVDGTVHTGRRCRSSWRRVSSQRVTDGQHGVAHVDIGGVAQSHSRQILGVDLQHSYIVIAVAAHQRGGIGVAVIEGDVDGAGAAITWLVTMLSGVDEATAGGGGLGLLAEDVGGDGGAVDGDHTVDRGAYTSAGLISVCPSTFADADVVTVRLLCCTVILPSAAAVLGQNGAAEAAGCADNSTTEEQGHHTACTAVVLLGLHRGVCHHTGCSRHETRWTYAQKPPDVVGLPFRFFNLLSYRKAM